MAGPVDRRLLPEILDADSELHPIKTRDFLYLLNNAVNYLRDQLAKLTNNTSITVTGAAGIVFIDIPLTADHTIIAPTVPADSVVIYTFTQDGTGGWVVDWATSAAFSGAEPRVALGANWKTTVAWRAITGSTFEPLRDHGSYLP